MVSARESHRKNISGLRTFEFEVPEYSVHVVARLLENYVQIKTTLNDRMPTPSAPLYKTTGTLSYQEKPLGAGKTTPWPFMTRPRAQQVPDGKKRARMSEDLHAAVLDLECAFQHLGTTDQQLLLQYYVIGGITLDELAAHLGLRSRGRLYERLQRIIGKLTRIMNDE